MDALAWRQLAPALSVCRGESGTDCYVDETESHTSERCSSPTLEKDKTEEVENTRLLMHEAGWFCKHVKKKKDWKLKVCAADFRCLAPLMMLQFTARIAAIPSKPAQIMYV